MRLSLRRADHGSLPPIELTEDEVVLALRNPRAAQERCVRRLGLDADQRRRDAGGPWLRVRPPRVPFAVPTGRELWAGEMERTVHETAEDLVERIDDYRPGVLESHVASMAPDALRSYLRMNVVRVVRVVEALRRRGFESGAILEVGSWFGSFALALQRLGYDVVACDRYATYGATFASYVDLLERDGVRVVSTMRENELREIELLGEFDVVLAAAVIEHVPHTPRFLLETLFGNVRPGGLLLLDTPNLARYWNRRALERGATIFQPLQDQYDCEPPWEGHHREYTPVELDWLLRRVGCVDVEVEFLDYNMLQFDELSSEHAECLAEIVRDPTQSDIILGVGTRPLRMEFN